MAKRNRNKRKSRIKRRIQKTFSNKKLTNAFSRRIAAKKPAKVQGPKTLARVRAEATVKAKEAKLKAQAASTKADKRKYQDAVNKGQIYGKPERIISKSQFTGEKKGLLNKDGSKTAKGVKRDKLNKNVLGTAARIAGVALGPLGSVVAGEVVDRVVSKKTEKTNRKQTEERKSNAQKTLTNSQRFNQPKKYLPKEDEGPVINAELGVNRGSIPTARQVSGEGAYSSFASPDVQGFGSNIATPSSVAGNRGLEIARSADGVLYNGDNQSVMANLLKQYEADAQLDIDPEKIRKQKVREANAEIRAINATRNDLLNAQRRVNADRTGTQRAQSARGGLLGSDFGTQQAERVQQYNEAQSGEIQNQFDAQVQGVLSQARQFADTEVANLRNLRQQGVTGLLDAIERQEEFKDKAVLNTVTAMDARGESPLTMQPEALQALAKTLGTTTDAVIASYQTVQAEKEAVDSPDGFSLSKDQIRYEMNPATGRYEQVGQGYNVGAEGSSSLSSEAKIAKENSLAQAENALSALAQISENPALTNGAANRVAMARVPGTPAADLRSTLTTLKALVSFGALQDMRNASKTGGALGQVSEREIDLLGATVASMNLSQSDEQLLENFKRVEETFNKMKKGALTDLAGTTTPNELPQKMVAPDGKVYILREDGTYDEESSLTNASSNQLSLDDAVNKIAKIESGGRYDAIGPVVPSGQYRGEQALGKYQVMPGNLPGWSQQAIGRVVSPQEFLNNPEIQDAIVKNQFAMNFNKYGNWDDVASVWFTGGPVKTGKNKKDVLGTSGSQYVRNFNLA